MTTIVNGESGASVRAKLNAALAITDQIAVTQPVDLDAIETRVNALDAAVILRGAWDASAGTFPGSGTAQAGDSYIVSVGGTVDSIAFVAGDRIIAILDNASTTTYAANWHKADYTDAVSSVAGLTGSVSAAAIKSAMGQFVTADYTDGSVTLAKMANLAAYTIIARGTGTTGVPGTMTAATDTVLRRNSGDLGFGQLAVNHLGNSIVSNAKLAQMATQTIKGRTTTGTGDPEDLTMTQIVAMLDTHFGNTDWRTGGGGGVVGATYFNGTGGTLAKGTPVCLASFDAGSGNPGMAAADADGAGLMPCIGILGVAVANGATGVPIISGGEITGLNTSSYSVGTRLYVSASGGLTSTRPTTGFIQVVAVVSRVDAVNGEIIVSLEEAGTLYIEQMTIAISDETTNLSTGTAKITFRMPYAFTLTGVRINVNTAPTGATILVDVNKTGVGSLFTTRPSIDDSEKTSVTAATPAVLSVTSLSDDDEITVDIDQVGSTTPGKGLKLTLYGYRT